MPLNSIPVTTTLDAVRSKIESMHGKLWIDVALLGGLVPGNLTELCPMLDEGVVGFKCFMVHSGLDDFPSVSEEEIAEALTTLKSRSQVNPGVLMFHAEHASTIDEHANPPGDPCVYHNFLFSRPALAEDKAIEAVIRLCKENPYPCHIVHLSAASALSQIASARTGGIPISAETTFHYLHFNSEVIPDGQTLFKCCPPIREQSNREALWDGVRNGIITQIISDHSPCPVAMKSLDNGKFSEAWGGIASLQLGLPVVWTEGRKRGLQFIDISRLCSRQTAQLVNLPTKGRIVVGGDADFVVWDPEEKFIVTPDILQFKNKRSPYEGDELYGVVKVTILRGERIYESGSFVSEIPVGCWIKKGGKRCQV